MAILTFWAADSTSPALTDLRDDLNMSAAAAGLVFSLYFVGRILGGLPAGLLADRIGPALTAALGAGFLLTGGLIAATAPNAPIVLGGRFLEGAGVALMVTAALLSILRARPAGGAAMSYFTFMTTIGSMLGLIFGGVLTGLWNWRAAIGLHVVLGAVALAVALVAWSRIRSRSVSNAEATGPPVAPFPRRALSVAMLCQLLVYMNYSIFVVSLPLYADAEFGANPEQISVLLIAQTVCHFVFAYPGGWLVRRFGSLPVLAGSIVTASLGIALTLAAPGLWWMIVPLVIYSTGQVTAVTSSGDYILQKGGRSGQAVGWMRLSGDAGLVIGPVLVGLVADLAGYRSPFLLLPLVTGVGVLLAISKLRRASLVTPPVSQA
ncbi:MAG: MFS transporter [Thermomicrobiales bacterium]|nr:MFS transporter [Thermomicrobiales bacterium]